MHGSLLQTKTLCFPFVSVDFASPVRLAFSFINKTYFFTFYSMLQYNQNETNYLTVTLKEKQTLANPYWLWRVVSDGSNIEYSAILSDTSTEPNRYNLFTFDSTQMDLPVGIYTYYIYEQSSAVNTDYHLATNLCEVGQMKVTGTRNQILSEPTYTTEYAWTNQ